MNPQAAGAQGQELFPGGLGGVIFDCDGVMIDSVAANREFYNRVLAHYGMPPMTEAQCTYCCMATARQSLEYLLPERLHPDIPRMGTEVVDYDGEILPLVKIFPGFLDFVSNLKEHRMRMAVLTNRTDAGVRSVLDIFHLHTYFDPVVTASCGFSKPQPGGALAILEQWQCDGRNVLYVGDSEVDRQTAQAAGLVFASLCSPRVGGDIRVDGFAPLWEILRPRLVSEVPCS